MTVHAFTAHGRPLIDPSTYRAHPLHVAERAWSESNCYVDVWIEVIHAIGLEPLACMPFVLAIDWEDDQWTFFKPPHEDLVELYGVGVQELNVWRPFIESTRQKLEHGKIVVSEVDAFYLPDTAGTDYKTRHTKTTIAILSLDVQGRVLDYLHNTGYHRLTGEDFDAIFRSEFAASGLPFFAEFVRIEQARKLPEAELTAISLGLLRKHLARRPVTNPISRWKLRLDADVAWLKQEGLNTYHAYAFATVRQLGSAFEFAAMYVRWLAGRGETGLEPAAEAFDGISSGCKSLIMKMARAVNSKKDVDFSAMLEDLEAKWDGGMRLLAAKYG